eukprot:CAMPEP_0115137388 /NCGR_PEP_ID=MMETSP0227-20121206/57002_1 /TAXON_ID=89957 /ORGANISM="Polarella glacialis, Strain CCMP 1383" /LENGTH=182 /DNA_ID=CAMNT_0002544729 /DNA_START=405 /DNA_END=951 /DNA_ORIENTATION=+
MTIKPHEVQLLIHRMRGHVAHHALLHPVAHMDAKEPTFKEVREVTVLFIEGDPLELDLLKVIRRFGPYLVITAGNLPFSSRISFMVKRGHSSARMWTVESLAGEFRKCATISCFRKLQESFISSAFHGYSTRLILYLLLVDGRHAVRSASSAVSDAGTQALDQAGRNLPSGPSMMGALPTTR